MKRVIGGNSLINGLTDLNKISNNTYAELDIGNKKTFAIFSANLIEKIFIEKQKYFTRGIAFIKMKNFFGNGLITSEDPDHIKNKRIMQSSFNKTNFDLYLEKSFNVAIELIEKNNDCISVSNLSDLFSFNSVSECLIGQQFPKEYISIYHDISEKIANIPHLVFSDEDMKDFNEVKKSLREYIKTSNSKLIFDMCENMSDDQVIDEVVTILGAGFETTSALNMWTIINIGQNKKILEELRKDAPNWIKENRAPKFEELYTSELLNNVIKETLRMYPPVYFSTRMVSSDINFENINMQKGTNIFLSQYVAHRSEIYYNSPNEWNPYRWNSEFEKNLPKGAYFPFGHGSRKCIGENLARSLVYMFVSIFIHKYNFELIGDFPKSKYSVSLLPEEFYMQISRR